MYSRALVLVLFLIPVSQTQAVLLYGLKTFEPFRLYQIDTESLGTPVLIGTIAFGSDLTELVGVTPDILYTVDRASERLAAVSTADASVVPMGIISPPVATHPRGFDISPVDGALYGVFPGLELRTINPSTGVTSFVVNISGAVGVEAIAFAPDGTLYATGSPASTTSATVVYTLDITTGVLSTIANTGIDIDALTFAPDGFLYGTDSLLDVSADLIRIDPLNGQVVNLGSTGVTGFNGIAAAFPKKVPEPAIIIMLGVGLATIGYVRRNKLN